MGIAAAYSAGTFLVRTPQEAGQLQPAVPNTGYFGSFPTVYHMRVWGYQSSTWLNGLVAFYMKRCKFAQGALICTDILVKGFEVSRMESKHYSAFLNKDMLHILVNIKKKQEGKCRKSLYTSCQLKVFSCVIHHHIALSQWLIISSLVTK